MTRGLAGKADQTFATLASSFPRNVPGCLLQWLLLRGFLGTLLLSVSANLKVDGGMGKALKILKLACASPHLISLEQWHIILTHPSNNSHPPIIYLFIWLSVLPSLGKWQPSMYCFCIKQVWHLWCHHQKLMFWCHSASSLFWQVWPPPWLSSSTRLHCGSCLHEAASIPSCHFQQPTPTANLPGAKSLFCFNFNL